MNTDAFAECPNDTHQLIQFVDAGVSDSHYEVESVVKEVAPTDTITSDVAQATSAVIGHASESAELAYMRVDACIAKRPTESVLKFFRWHCTGDTGHRMVDALPATAVDMGSR